MKNIYLKAIFLISLSCACSLSFGSDFYISPNGNDNNDGTKSKPFATLGRAISEVILFAKDNNSEDITIWLNEGIYNITEPVCIQSSSFTNYDGQIIIKTNGKKSAVIDGGMEINGWSREGDIWVASLPETFSKTVYPRELFINQKRGIRARHPDQDYLRVKKAGEDRRTSFFYNDGDFPVPSVEETTELVFLHDWSITRIAVKEIIETEKRLVTVDSIGAKDPDFFNIDHWEPDPRYFLENAKGFLSEVNEWYFDKSDRKIFLKLSEGQDPNKINISIPVSEGLVKLTGNEELPLRNIHFEGIIFRNSFWPIPKNGYCGVQACHYDPRPDKDGWTVVPAAFYAEWTENCTLSKCSFENLGGSGLWFGAGCKYCSVSDSRFTDISGNGIMIGEGRDRIVNGDVWWRSAPGQVALGNKIENCIIEECGKQFFGAVGIWCGLTAETLIKDNKVFNLPYTGVSIGWMWSPVPTPCRDNTIEGNHIHDIMKVLSDGGGIYMLGLQPGSKITGNMIHDVSLNAGRAESNGMFLDEGTTNVVVADNLIYNIAKSPLRFHKATMNLVEGNYLFCGEGVPPVRYNNTKEEDIKKVDNKVFYENDDNFRKELKKAKKKW